ncbi:MAG TPA: hypothetical protein VG496_05465 [Myxococcales bacterium]|nr:hypothetical protein [Myxococcales bacterium]
MQPILLAVALIATPNFPAAIRQNLGLQAAPQCTVCHATNAGGAGTVVKPFGVYLLSRGLRPFDESSLRNALLADSGEHHSSNSSGIPDIDALKAGEDPNDPVGAGGNQLAPAYGCSSSGSTTPLMLLVAVACALRRRLSRAGDGRHRHS